MTTFPVRSLVERCKRYGVAAQLSNSAGTYVCNRVYYEILYTIAQRHLPMQALFVHVPCISEKGASPAIDKEQIVTGVVGIMGMIIEQQEKVDCLAIRTK